jgi:hypothetical protein
MQRLNSKLRACLLLAWASTAFAIPAYAIDGPTWARQASPLDIRCSSPARNIASPDKVWTAQVTCHTRKDDDPIYSLRVTDKAGRMFDVPLRERSQELLWAPDSTAFLVNGSQAGYWGFFVDVYNVTANGVDRHEVTDLAQRDMVTSFPPCRAANSDKVSCARVTKNPQYNMSGLGWASDSRSIFIFAEVPCSSSYGE